MRRYFNYLKNQRAQIVLPAILLVPTILLVIYLLFETAKLSRFKIRSQFALDSAAFIELTPYSQFLNATSYMNGAFPYRLFRENLGKMIPKRDGCEEIPEYGCPDEDKISYYEIFRQAGAFPAMAKMDSNPSDNAGRWELKYHVATPANQQSFTEGKGRPANWNTDTPKVDPIVYGINSKQLVGQYEYVVISRNQDENNNGNKKDDDGPIAPLSFYISIYKILEGTYKAQKKAYEELTEDGEMFRKSYYYNSSACKLSQCGKEGVMALKKYKLGMESVYIDKFNWYWRSSSRIVTDVMQVEFTKEKQEYEKFMPLYQFSYLDKSTRSKLKQLYTGVDIREPITPPENYFRVNLKKYAQKLHVRAALQCTNESNNCVWPNPTPKYQVRLYP